MDPSAIKELHLPFAVSHQTMIVGTQALCIDSDFLAQFRIGV